MERKMRTLIGLRGSQAIFPLWRALEGILGLFFLGILLFSFWHVAIVSGCFTFLYFGSGSVEGFHFPLETLQDQPHIRFHFWSEPRLFAKRNTYKTYG